MAWAASAWYLYRGVNLEPGELGPWLNEHGRLSSGDPYNAVAWAASTQPAKYSPAGPGFMLTQDRRVWGHSPLVWVLAHPVKSCHFFSYCLRSPH